MYVEIIGFASHPLGESSISHSEKREADDREILFPFPVAAKRFRS